VSAIQVAVDAFGNALGENIAGDMNRPRAQEAALGVFSDQGSPQQSFRRGEIAEQNTQARADAVYGWNTGNDGLGFKPFNGVGSVGMQYAGVRSPMFDDTRIFSDSVDPVALVNLGQDGRSTAQVLPIGIVGGAGGAGGGGVVGGGYETVRPRGAGAAPGYDFVRDLPVGAPGSMQANPSLGLGAPPQQTDGRSWSDFIVEGLPLPVTAMGGLLDNLVFKRLSEILGKNLETAGTTRPSDSAAHHIVPEGDERAEALRQRLKDLNIDINSAENGVFLPQKPGSTAPGAYHPKLNNDNYYYQLRKDFRGINSRSDALDVLSNIRGQLLNGTYPGSQPVPAAKK
jgi:hypothetical protein